jgi:DNA sulfur modification protein DndC
MHKIRQLWLHEEGDWEDSLPKIYQEETGESMDWLVDDQAGVGGIEKRLLEEASRGAGLPEGLLQELFDVERSHQGMTRRLGIYDKLDDVLSKNWETLEEALANTKNQPGVGS